MHVPQCGSANAVIHITIKYQQHRELYQISTISF